MKPLVNPPATALWFLLLVLPLLFAGNSTVANTLILFVSTYCLSFIGSALLSLTAVRANLLPVTHSGLSLFLGSLLFSLLMVIPNVSGIILLSLLLAASLVLILFTWRRLSISFDLSAADAVAFGISFLLMLLVSAQGDLTRGLHAAPVRLINDGMPDPHFFTSIVASLRDGGLFNAVYEINSPINYHSLGFFIPALWADLFRITAHQALWGLAMPVYKVLTFLLFYEVCFYFFKERVSRKTYWFIGAALALPVLLAPLHPLYLLKGQVSNFIFSGVSYIVPGGNPPFTFGFPLFLLSLLLFIQIDWQTAKWDATKVLFGIVVALIIIGKLPLYFALVVFLGTIVLKRVLFDKESIRPYLLLMIASIALSLILYKVFLSSHPIGKLSIQYGYLVEWFARMFKRSAQGFANHIMMYGLIVALFALWLGLRLVGLWGLAKSSDQRQNEFLSGSLMALLASVILSLFLHVEYFDENGNLLRDGTFDVDQFIRASFYILSMAGSIGLLSILLNLSVKKIVRKIAAVVTVLWCILALSAWIANGRLQVPQQNFAWYDDNLGQLKSGQYNEGLIAVNPFEMYYGIMLSSAEVGKYWSAMAQGDGCYNSTLKNAYRWSMYRKLLTVPDKPLLKSMHQDGVKYIIATPADSAKLTNVSAMYPECLKKRVDSKWIYELACP